MVYSDMPPMPEMSVSGINMLLISVRRRMLAFVRFEVSAMRLLINERWISIRLVT